MDHEAAQKSKRTSGAHTTRTPKKTTVEANVVLGTLMLLVSTAMVILGAGGLRTEINHVSAGLEMIAVAIGLNGFIRLRYRSTENSWVAKGSVLLAAAGVGLMGIRQPL